MVLGLIIILLLVLLLPFTKIVERNLEVFLFVMGILSVVVSQVFSWELFEEAITHPINITLAVLIAGFLFKWFQKSVEHGIAKISNAMPFALFVAVFVTFLGLLSSLITAIIAAIILVVVVSVLQLDRQSEVRLVVLSCFAIGMGAALTPIGEPLSTIVVGKLNEEFTYLLQLIGIYVIPGVAAFGVLAAFMVRSNEEKKQGITDAAGELKRELVAESAENKYNETTQDNALNMEIPAYRTDTSSEIIHDEVKEYSNESMESDSVGNLEYRVSRENTSEDKLGKDMKDGIQPESYKEIILRSLKIYLFVMALTFLGAGFQPLIERYLLDLSPLALYWINMVSAVLDNATLAAAEISPAMSEVAIRNILLGLLISGGMLIPGNIPNIIAAGKLKITSLQYARVAFPIGLVTMAVYFVIIIVVG